MDANLSRDLKERFGANPIVAPRAFPFWPRLALTYLKLVSSMSESNLDIEAALRRSSLSTAACAAPMISQIS
jgi:hypothetical protein